MAISLAAEMITINELMQQHIALGMDPAKVKQAACTNIKAKIMNMNHGQMSTADGALLTAKLPDMIGLDGPDKMELAQCIQNAMHKQSIQYIGSGCNGCQTLKCIYNYLTASEWASLDDRNRGIGTHVTTVADRLTKLGIFNASEDTKRWGVGVICAVCFDTIPTPKSAYALKTDLTAQIGILSEGRKATWTMATLAKYPDTPAEMPLPHFRHAYDPSDPPVPREIERMREIAMWVPMRSNNKLLRDNFANQLQGMNPNQMQDMNPNQMQGFQVMYNMMKQICGGAPAGGALSCHIYIYIYT